MCTAFLVNKNRRNYLFSKESDISFDKYNTMTVCYFGRNEIEIIHTLTLNKFGFWFIFCLSYVLNCKNEVTWQPQMKSKSFW